MKKPLVVLIVVVILVILAVVLGGTHMTLQKNAEEAAVAEAEAGQKEAYEQYTALMANVQASSLTVTEKGKTIGVYSLEQLGLQEQIQSDAEAGFEKQDRMEPAEFAALTPEEKIAWQAETQWEAAAVKPDMALADISGVMLDLEKEIRVSAKSAYAYFDGGAYAIEPETAGTQLNRENVEQALLKTLEAGSVDANAPMNLTFEVTDCDCYRGAAVKAADGVFDYAALLQRDAEGIVIPLDFLGKSQSLQVASVVTVDESGVVQADRAALEQLAAGWAETYRAEETPYILDSYVVGPIEIEFLEVNYELDQAALVEQLAQQVCLLDGSAVKAPFYCTRDGQPFALDGTTFVEVDIDNQQMTYYENGEVVVTTPVVTGYPWGHWTPPGLYAVEDIDVQQWLYGPDYTVFVEYWVGFHGAYGIHDASWRTIFGGKKYLSDGSHGCVNTPTEAMQTIHERIEIGVPVLVHDEREADD